MNISITGHTKGIGLALKSYFESQGHNVIGFSRTNGYDISNIECLDKIVEESKHCDVFINNAYAAKGQTALLEKMILEWTGTTNSIINLNSKTTLIPTDRVPDFLKEYVEEKLEQKRIISSRFLKARPHIINITVGLVETEMSTIFNARKIDPNNLAKFIYTLVEFKDQVAVQDVMLEVPDLDWNDIK